MSVKYCGCKAETPAAKYQDEVHGQGKRVHTESPKTGMEACTICGKKTTIGKKR